MAEKKIRYNLCCGHVSCQNTVKEAIREALTEALHPEFGYAWDDEETKALREKRPAPDWATQVMWERIRKGQ